MSFIFSLTADPIPGINLPTINLFNTTSTYVLTTTKIQHYDLTFNKLTLNYDLVLIVQEIMLKSPYKLNCIFSTCLIITTIIILTLCFILHSLRRRDSLKVLGFSIMDYFKVRYSKT